MNPTEIFSTNLNVKPHVKGITSLCRPRGTKTRGIVMKFGTLVVGLEENIMSIDQLAQRRNVF